METAGTIFAILLDKIPGIEASKDTIGRHVGHLRELESRGALVLAGPFADHPSGLVVVRAANKNEAVRIAQSDPFVLENVRRFEVRTWLLANALNNYLE